MAMKVRRKRTIPFQFSEKHKAYIRNCRHAMYNFAEGAIRAGKTIDNVYAFAHELKTTKDRIHLATGSTSANAKLNIGDANGFGLEWIFRGQCHWGKFKGNECLYIKGPDTRGTQKVVIFAGGGKADSFKKIRGNSYGMWIATEINLHHDTAIKEAFNRTAAADNRKFFWDLNPDAPSAPIYSEYIDKYRKKSEAGQLLGGCNYSHFTIHDNVTLSAERRQVLIDQYDKNSIWYQRDILGKRCVAEGLIYRIFADCPGRFAVEDKPKGLARIVIGVDFGGTGSGHAFVATGITSGYQQIVALSSERHFGEIDPDALGELFVDFCLKVIQLFGRIDQVYCDSAEQVLIRGLRTTAGKHGLSWLRIGNAYKEQINERIRLLSRMMAQGRFFVFDGYCDTLSDALCTAVWDPKDIKETTRLDDGSSDIDSLDAFEYTWERDILKFIKYE